MKVAVWHNLPSGGGARALCDQVRGLLERGHQVEVWTASTADRDFAPLPDEVKQHVVPFPGSRVRTRLRGRFPHTVGRPGGAQHRAHAQAAADQIVQARPDIVLAHPCRYARVTPLARCLAGRVPSVLYLQEPYRWYYEALPDNMWAAPLRPGVAGRLMHAVDIASARLRVREEIEGARAYDQLLVNSYFSRESVLRAYGLESRVCYLGVDSERFRRGSPRRHNGTILSIAALTPEKRPDFLVRAVARLPAELRVITWIGNTTTALYESDIRALAAAHDVDLRLHLGVDDAEVLRLLGEASVLAYAPRLEPFGYVPLEAAAAGLPAVVVGEGGVRETVMHGITGLVTANDEEVFAAALLRLFRDPALGDKLAQQALTNAQQVWSLEQASRRLENALLHTKERTERRRCVSS